MTERILKSFIALMEEFNHVRNQRSLAHDNPILNAYESELIVSGVLVSITFLRSLEKEQSKDEDTDEGDDLPF